MQSFRLRYFDDSHPGRCHWAVALLAFQANKTVLKSTSQWEKQYLWVKGSARQIDFYNLDVIISVGYRVSSHRGTQFRIWATQRLKEYLIKGFTLDDERLKQNSVGNYFEELLTRIRDIRSSEKVFWRKVLDIYATSIDYDPHSEQSKEFFAIIQNKMHWAAHGQTAAEVIYSRVNAGKPNMGLTSWTGENVRKLDVEIAKNYLNKVALNKARSEYDKYRCQLAEFPSQVEKDFFESVKKVKQIDVIKTQDE